MDKDTRLMRALAAERAPRRDPGFTLGVIRAAEREQFKLRAAGAVLRGAGLTAAIAAIFVPVAAWAASNPGGVQDGVVAVAGLLTLVAGARLFAARARVLLQR